MFIDLVKYIHDETELVIIFFIKGASLKDKIRIKRTDVNLQLTPYRPGGL